MTCVLKSLWKSANNEDRGREEEGASQSGLPTLEMLYEELKKMMESIIEVQKENSRLKMILKLQKEELLVLKKEHPQVFLNE